MPILLNHCIDNAGDDIQEASIMTEKLPTILQQIIADKSNEVAEKKKVLPQSLIENMIAEQDEFPRGFYRALSMRAKNSENAVIAEIKKASPSKGIICEQFDPGKIAKSYAQGGATCLSVLTDEKYFQGSELYLDAARHAVQLPVLRKDFIIDTYQIFESRAMGADCILLIAACLSQQQLYDMTRLAYDLGMDVLVEVHNMAELDKTAGLPLRMIGINNRNLHTFEVDLTVTFELAVQIPAEILIITESGISTRNDVQLMNSMAIRAFLVGESLMRESNPGDKLAELFH